MASETFDGQYRIKLESFEGPLDLLLHLIQQHELDILDIPVSFITEKYLEYLKLMQVLSIEIASEYLVMAATLVHIKSKMLLPVAPAGQDDGMPQEEEEDPRAELVRRLLEYQKYKAAAAELAERGTLGRDVFPRGVEEETLPGPAPFAHVEVFSLLEAFEKILKRTKVKIDHEVVFDRISITDRIVELTEKLQGRRAVRFEQLFLGSPNGPPTRFDLVITFLAMLEMCRMKLLRVYQTGPLAPLYMGLIDEGSDLSDEDRATADQEAERLLAEPPEPAEVAIPIREGVQLDLLDTETQPPAATTETPAEAREPQVAVAEGEPEVAAAPEVPVEPAQAELAFEAAELEVAVEAEVAAEPEVAVEAVEPEVAVEAVEPEVALEPEVAVKGAEPEVSVEPDVAAAPEVPVEPAVAELVFEAAEVPVEAVEPEVAVEAVEPEVAAAPGVPVEAVEPEVAAAPEVPVEPSEAELAVEAAELQVAVEAEVAAEPEVAVEPEMAIEAVEPDVGVGAREVESAAQAEMAVETPIDPAEADLPVEEKALESAVDAIAVQTPAEPLVVVTSSEPLSVVTPAEPLAIATPAEPLTVVTTAEPAVDEFVTSSETREASSQQVVESPPPEVFETPEESAPAVEERIESPAEQDSAEAPPSDPPNETDSSPGEVTDDG